MDVVVAVVAVLLATVVVLRDVASYDRPPRAPRPSREPRPARPQKAVEAPEPVTVPEPAPVLAPLAVLDVLALSHDVADGGRRATSALLLLTLTLLAACAVGALLYRAVVAIG